MTDTTLSGSALNGPVQDDEPWQGRMKAAMRALMASSNPNQQLRFAQWTPDRQEGAGHQNTELQEGDWPGGAESSRGGRPFRPDGDRPAFRPHNWTIDLTPDGRHPDTLLCPRITLTSPENTQRPSWKITPAGRSSTETLVSSALNVDSLTLPQGLHHVLIELLWKAASGTDHTEWRALTRSSGRFRYDTSETTASGETLQIRHDLHLKPDGELDLLIARRLSPSRTPRSNASSWVFHRRMVLTEDLTRTLAAGSRDCERLTRYAGTGAFATLERELTEQLNAIRARDPHQLISVNLDLMPVRKESPPGLDPGDDSERRCIHFELREDQINRTLTPAPEEETGTPTGAWTRAARLPLTGDAAMIIDTLLIHAGQTNFRLDFTVLEKRGGLKIVTLHTTTRENGTLSFQDNLQPPFLRVVVPARQAAELHAHVRRLARAHGQDLNTEQTDVPL